MKCVSAPLLKAGIKCIYTITPAIEQDAKFMKLRISIILIGLSIKSFGQAQELRSSDLIKYTYPFKIENNRIDGIGADTLLKKIAESQFFMLGEEHFSPQISELTNVLLPYFATNDYKNLALEIGPFTSSILRREIKKHNSIYTFNQTFFNKYKDIPFPFFDGDKDELFLKTALNSNFKLWGVDQEYVTAPLFLIEEIYKSAKDTVATRKAYLKAKDYLAKQLDHLNKKQPNIYFQMFDSNNDFTRYISLCNEPKQKEIIQAIRLSTNIYKKTSTGGGNFPRMEYMKRNFADNYKKASKNESIPKVLIKMGSMHLGWGKSWLGVYDLGNMINEIAYFNNTKSVSINTFSRYGEEEDGSIYDYMDEEEGKNISLILELGTKDSWMLIDCQKIVDLAKDRKVKLNNDLSFLLSRYNYLLLVPLKTKVNKNY